MTIRLAAISAICLVLAGPAGAHRLDEYLQATLISVDKNRVQAQIRLIPGVAVVPIVLAAIDTNADGVISETEQRAYAGQVVRDLVFTLDGERLTPRIALTRFPPLEEFKQGLGEIQIELEANLPAGGPGRNLVFENHHRRAIAAYLVNCLVPSDPDIRVIAQHHDYLQSLYRLEYTQASVPSAWPFVWPGGIAILLLARLAYLFWRRGGERRLQSRLFR